MPFSDEELQSLYIDAMSGLARFVIAAAETEGLLTTDLAVPMLILEKNATTELTSQQTILAIDSSVRKDGALIKTIIATPGYSFAVISSGGIRYLLDIRQVGKNIEVASKLLHSFQNEKLDKSADTVLTIGWSQKNEQIIYICDSLTGQPARGERKVLKSMDIWVCADDINITELENELEPGLLGT